MKTDGKAMNCDHIKEQLPDYLNHQLPDADQFALEAHVAKCPECQEELQTMQQMWQMLGSVPVPEPSENLRPEFYAMLASYKESLPTASANPLGGFFGWLQSLMLPQSAVRLAYGLSLLAIGLIGGYWLNNKKTAATPEQQQLATLTTQVEQMRQVMLLSLIKNPSASERLRAVSYTKEISGPNDRVIDALLSTLNHDDNVNVRLATLEALAELADEPKVRMGLVQSLPQQESPLVQSALADVMVQLQEKRSVQPLRRLLKQPDLNQTVKDKIKESIKNLSNGQPAAPSISNDYDETFLSPQPDRSVGAIV
ncbi:HEAT repeat domain-containing protein [Hymenobacter sp. BT188]|uniref:HEAT repeat domain-containing protein n=1 Tax=Hymenobacter sp. BT188 TaxID=2763504 RepID=UPI0021C8FF52|nr:HEAT repeat domain-containing protein [Hymenobacter sp. BT188]